MLLWLLIIPLQILTCLYIICVNWLMQYLINMPSNINFVKFKLHLKFWWLDLYWLFIWRKQPRYYHVLTSRTNTSQLIEQGGPLTERLHSIIRTIRTKTQPNEAWMKWGAVFKILHVNMRIENLLDAMPMNVDATIEVAFNFE